MTYVIYDPCVSTKDASCVSVCPVDCIHPTPDEPGFAEHDQLYIDPEECIDCDACAGVCPVQAAIADRDLPDAFSDYLEKNAAFFADASSA